MKLERFDPRSKFFALAAVTTVSVAARDPLMVLALLVFTAAVLEFGGVDMRSAFMRVRGILKLILMLFVIQCVFTRSGSPLAELGGFTIITDDGVRTAALVSLRLIVVLLSALMILTSPPRDQLLALMQMHVPYEIAYMVMAAMRFVPILRQEAENVLCAVQMRGTNLKKASLRRKMTVYVSVLVPIVAGAIRRSERMSAAMEARAFRCMPGRTSMRRLHMHVYDWVFMAVTTAVITSLLLIL